MSTRTNHPFPYAAVFRLRNLGYPVGPGWMVARAPVGVTRLSENIVLWRDADGQVHALEDRCPHRGARLTLGWALGDRVACWYHGVEVRHDGVEIGRAHV